MCDGDSSLAMQPKVMLFDEPTSSLDPELTDEVLGVREDYLSASRRIVDENYGGLAGYLQAAGVTPQ